MKKNILINNSTIVKQTNVDLVRKYMRQTHSITRNELSHMTGLSTATCRNILKEMLQQNEVSEYHLDESSGGRPAYRYKYNKNFIQAACIGVFYDSHVKTIWYAVINSFGEYITEGSAAYDTIGYKDISNIVEHIAQKYPAVNSLVISIPGKSWNESIYVCDIKELEGIPLVKQLTDDHRLAPVLESDIDMIAFGYYKSHPELDGKAVSAIIYPEGTYPGAGIIVDGTILRGDHNMAGEVSFISADDSTRHNNLLNTLKNNELESSLLMTTTAMISVINPSRIMFTGKSMTPKLVNSISDKCADIIPPVFLPEFEYIQDCFGYYKAGITAMALHNTTTGLRLISGI